MANDLTETLENTALVLYAPRLPEATVPVVGAHAGVSLRIYDLAPMGATVEVDPYLGQQPGDTVTLNLNGQPGIDSEQTEAVDDIVTLYIPKKLLLADIINRLTYTVTRGSQNMGTSEPPRELLYNAIRPGNQDTNPGEEGHSRLDLLLPDAIKHGVGPDFPTAGAQVCVSYPYCRAYDLIRLNCNGHDVFHTVTSLQAPKPGSDEPVKVCFTLTRADLEKAKDHPQFKFSYTVTDQLGNGPDTDSPWSAPQIVDVDLAGNRLPAPILRETLNDPSDDPGTIDLEKLGKNPLLLIVLTNDHRFLPGDTLNATYTAKVTGQPDVVVTATGAVEADEFGQKRPSVLQVANDRVIAGSVVTVTYQLLRNSTLLGTSREATARVIGEGLPDLQAPRLQKSVNGVLDPLDIANLQGANGQVEVLGYHKGDTVQLIVEGTPGAGSPTFTPLPLNANSRANFPLDRAFIAANMGKEVKLSYLLIRDGKPLPSSPTLTASVGTIPDGHPSLPIPAIDRAPGTELDVTQLQAADQLRVGEWPHQVVGQNVWLRYDGFDTNGAIFYEDRKGEPHNTLPGLISPVPIAWLKTLKDGSELKITFRVNFDKVANENSAVTFTLRTYTVRAIKLPELVFNTSPITSNRKLYIWPAIPNDVIFFGSWREASGGRPPYVYSSSNSRVSSVNPSTGRVTILGKGTATITVRDQAAQSKSYDIFINEAVFECFDLGRGNYSQIENIANARGLRLGTANGELSLISTLYKGGHWPINDAEGTWFKSYYSGGNLWGITFIYSNKGSGNTSPTTIRCGLGLK